MVFLREPKSERSMMISQHNCKRRLLRRMGIQKKKRWIDDECRAVDDDD
jgi:hypothetical protein